MVPAIEIKILVLNQYHQGLVINTDGFIAPISLAVSDFTNLGPKTGQSVRLAFPFVTTATGIFRECSQSIHGITSSYKKEPTELLA